MADVATDAGVSVMTVSYTYSTPHRVAAATRARVVESAQRLGYAGPDPSARSLRQGRSNNLAVVVGEGLLYAFEDPQSSRFLAGVAAVCLEYGQNLVLLPAHGDERDAARIRETPADAFILWTRVFGGNVLDAVLASNRPVALQGAAPDGLPDRVDVHVVGIDDRAAAAAVAASTFAGAQAPAVLSFPLTPDDEPKIVYGPRTDDIVFPGTRARLRGIEDACRELGIPWKSVAVLPVRNHRADARPLVEKLFGGSGRPDAVAAMSDELALAVVDVVAARGLTVPADLTLSGWDDSAEGEAIGLTSIHQSLEEQGRQCALLALGHLEHAVTPAWSLALRASTEAGP
jgi:DNA-binding LacI/PurR family transcriptional regulator